MGAYRHFAELIKCTMRLFRDIDGIEPVREKEANELKTINF